MLLDITHARLMHLEWELQLEKVLSGRAKTAAIGTHDECMLGHWIYNEGMQKYSSIPELEILEQEHKSFHRFARQIIREHKAGQNNQAEKTFQTVKKLSKEIIFLLTVIELSAFRKKHRSYAIRHPLKTLSTLFSKK